MEVCFGDAHSDGFHSDSIVLLVRLLRLAGFENARKDPGNELRAWNLSVPINQMVTWRQVPVPRNGQVIRRTSKTGDLGEKQCLSGFRRARINIDE